MTQRAGTAADVANRDEKAELTGFGRVAKRISGWTSNLLATAVILIAALVFGRQVIEWWGADAQLSGPHRRGDALVGDSFGGGGFQPFFLQFGDLSWTLRREVFRGDKEAMFAALRRACREAAQRTEAASASPGPAEQKLLRTTESLKPVEAAVGKWQIYQLDGPFPLVAAVRQSTRRPDSSSANREPVAAGRRVVSWGLGLGPVSDALGAETVWTLFTCSAGGGLDRLLPDLPPLPVPPGGRRTMSLRAASGEALIGLNGQGRPEAWMGFFTGWFQREGWSVLRGWRQGGGVWRAGFGGVRGGHVEIQLWADRGDALAALMTAAPQ